MFSLVTPPCMMLQVHVEAPEGAGETGTFTIDVKYLGVEERRAYLRRIADEDRTDPQILDDLLVGWDGLTDEAGVHLDFNDPATRRRVLDVPWVYEAVLDAVLAELGLAAASGKNS